MLSFGLLAVLSWATLTWLIPVALKVAIGLGAVIFVHELGHFLVAKACGVKCEKFMIGFDIAGYRIARQWGETLYGIGILPLGGYVKMLGQDDDPAHIAEQMKKSQINASSSDAVPIEGPNGETFYVDRRSYLAKSVPQRMAIISAGVIMNIIFAFIFAVIAYGMGVPYVPSIVSETVPGSPAWQAQLRPGDEIVQIADEKNPTFMQLMSGVTLGDQENGIPVIVRRADTNKTETITLKPKRQQSGLAMIGVSGPQSLVLSARQAAIEHSPAAEARLISPPASELKVGEPKFQSGDKIVRVGDQSVAGYREFAAILAQQADMPLQITIERPTKQGPPDTNVEAAKSHDTVELTFEVPAHSMRSFGLSMKMGPIAAVQEGSPAAIAGLKAGDLIMAVDGKPPGEAGGWTPDTLPDLMLRAAAEQREVELTMERDGNEGRGPEQITAKARPRPPSMYYSGIPLGAPQGVEALGLAYQVTNEIQSVVPKTPAAATDIKPGERITAAKIAPPQDKDGKTPKPITVALSDEAPNWPALVDTIQFAPPETAIMFTVSGVNGSESREVELPPTTLPDVFTAPRGFLFEPIKRMRVASTFADAVRYGWDETAEALTMVVRFLNKLGTQVPLTMLGGPGTIVAAAGQQASEGISSLLIFLTMLSANLAVINFLPIPLLDGGHMVFLAYEGVRGRPANERVVVALHTAGFVFIISLMLFVIGLDIQRWLFT